MSKAEQTISPELQTLITTSVTAAVVAMAKEMRKPPEPTPQEQDDLQTKQEERRAMADGKQQKANERWFQEHGCQHKHSGPLGGTHCVYVQDNGIPQSPGFVLCMRCQGRFRPDEPLMRRLDPTAIFDAVKYNTLMADCQQNGAEILG